MNMLRSVKFWLAMILLLNFYNLWRDSFGGVMWEWHLCLGLSGIVLLVMALWDAYARRKYFKM